jgi:high-affinity K+ transport system ATPase subunit B
MFVTFYPELQSLNVMHLATPQSAMLSAIIFNALIIVALIPLALRGVAYRPVGAAAILRRNLLIYGVGGLIVPFIGIKLIDLLIGAALFERPFPLWAKQRIRRRCFPKQSIALFTGCSPFISALS